MRGMSLNQKLFFFGVQELVGRWTKHVENNGDCTKSDFIV
jgi:hypothetical protein